MHIKFSPAVLSGGVTAIPSKSDAHRLLICAALADGPTRLSPAGVSDDIDATVDCLRTLGADLARTEDCHTVVPISAPADAPLLDCRESGSTLRFLLPVAAVLCDGVGFAGGGRLPDRPLETLTRLMEDHGVSFSASRIPLRAVGRLRGGTFLLPGNISSQYLSGLLMALPMAAEDSVIRLTTPLESSSYVDMTLSALARFGAAIHADADGYRIPGGQRLRTPGTVTVDGDWSNAAFFLAAGVLFGSVTVEGLSPDSLQGDRAILPLLRRFGGEVFWRDGAVIAKPAPLTGCEIDVSDIPDLLPILAVVASYAQGETRFTNAARLRLKESDRLQATAAMLRSLGGQAAELSDGLLVRGGALAGGETESFNDHRMAMSAAIAAAGCQGPVVLRDAQAVNKSYPSFFSVYRNLGGVADVI